MPFFYAFDSPSVTLPRFQFAWLLLFYLFIKTRFHFRSNLIFSHSGTVSVVFLGVPPNGHVPNVSSFPSFFGPFNQRFLISYWFIYAFKTHNFLYYQYFSLFFRLHTSSASMLKLIITGNNDENLQQWLISM